MAETKACMKSLVEFIRKQPVHRLTIVPEWGSVVLPEYIKEELGVPISLYAYPIDMQEYITPLILETKSSGLITALMKADIPEQYGELIPFMTILWPKIATFL